MDPPRQPKKTNLNREPKRNQNHSGSPHHKDAYARLLSQHNGAKFSQYLEQYAQDTSAQREALGTSTVLRAQSDRLNIPQQRGYQVPNHLSDSSDFSPSSLKSKGDERSLSLYMEKVNSHSAQQECEKKVGAFERQQRGQRKDTATSQDGDIESGEDAASLKLSQSKKQQKKNKDSKDSSSPKKASAVGQELKMNKSKKKNQPRSSEDDSGRQGTSRADVDAQLMRPKSSCNKNQNLQQTRGKKKIKNKNLLNVSFINYAFCCCFKFSLVSISASTSISYAEKNKSKGGRSSNKQVFESYMTLEEVSDGLKRGELIQVWLHI